MKQATRSNLQGASVMEKGPSVVPENFLAGTVAPEAIRQLFIDLLSEGYIIRSRAAGESMSPCIRKGDLLVVEPMALEDAGIGDIVAFRKEETHSVLTTHRVVARGEHRGQGYLITQGDQNRYRDFPLSPQDVLGKVVGIERKGQRISLETPFYRLRGYLVARLSLGLWILGVLKRKIRPFGESGRNDKDD